MNDIIINEMIESQNFNVDYFNDFLTMYRNFNNELDTTNLPGPVADC